MAGQVLGVSAVLVGLSSKSGSSLALLPAAALTVYTLLGPLRLLRAAQSEALHRLVRRIATAALATVACATGSILAVNSGVWPLDIAGNIGMIATVAVSIGLLASGVFSAAVRLLPDAVARSWAVFGQWRAAASLTLRLLVGPAGTTGDSRSR